MESKRLAERIAKKMKKTNRVSELKEATERMEEAYKTLNQHVMSEAKMGHNVFDDRYVMIAPTWRLNIECFKEMGFNVNVHFDSCEIMVPENPNSSYVIRKLKNLAETEVLSFQLKEEEKAEAHVDFVINQLNNGNYTIRQEAILVEVSKFGENPSEYYKNYVNTLMRDYKFKVIRFNSSWWISIIDDDDNKEIE